MCHLCANNLQNPVIPFSHLNTFQTVYAVLDPVVAPVFVLVAAALALLNNSPGLRRSW